MGESKSREEPGLAADRALPDGRILPDDFDAEDAALARTLNRVYHIQAECLPPRYTQTLLGYPQYMPVSDDFVERVTNTVFARLELPRCRSLPPPVVRRYVMPHRHARPRRSVKMESLLRQGMVAIMALMMLFSFEALFTSTAFADMVRFLVVGHSGVQAVASYPALSPTSTVTIKKQPKPQGDHRILYTPQWAGESVQGYSYIGMNIMDKQWWSDSAVISLNYEKHDASGVHHLNILEFPVRSQDVLQVVQNGSAQEIAVGANNGIFIDGHWLQRKPPASPIWVTDQRAMLIFSVPDDPQLVTWIATDDVAGSSQSDVQQQLTTIAQSLNDMSIAEFDAHASQIQLTGDHLSRSLQQIFGGDVIAVSSDSATGDQSVTYIQLGASDSNSDTSGTMPTQ